MLAERLNGYQYAHEQEELAHPWQCLDRELVERIAKDHHLSQGLIESLAHSSHSWISEFFAGMSLTDNRPSELAVFKRVVETMRALASAGHVILIGLGSMYMTHDMAAGVHIRLVAPLEHRVRAMAKLRNVSEARALGVVEQLDGARKAFFKRYWPKHPLSAESFHLTLNSGLMREDQMVDCVLPLLKPLLHAPA